MGESRQTPSQKTYLHFTHRPSGLQDRCGLSQAHEQTHGIYKIGHSIYIVRTLSIHDVYGDLKIPIKQTSHSERY